MAPATRPRRTRRAQPTRVHGEIRGSGTSAWEAVYALVRGVPPGRVMTYGQIAGLLGGVLSPKAVGWAMHVFRRPALQAATADGRNLS